MVSIPTLVTHLWDFNKTEVNSYKSTYFILNLSQVILSLHVSFSKEKTLSQALNFAGTVSFAVCPSSPQEFLSLFDWVVVTHPLRLMTHFVSNTKSIDKMKIFSNTFSTIRLLFAVV